MVALLGCPSESGHAVLPVPSVAGHLLQVAVVVAAVAAVDQLLTVAHAWGSPGARWFCLHSVVNVAIAVLASPDLLFTIVKPMCSMMVRAGIGTRRPPHRPPHRPQTPSICRSSLGFPRARAAQMQEHLLTCPTLQSHTLIR